MLLSKKAKKQSGSALGLLMIFLTAMMILGVGLVSAANNHAKQSGTAVRADKQFYAAEAAAQLGAQMLMNELKAEDLYYSNSAKLITDIETDFYDRLEDRLKELYDFLEPVVAPKDGFNGEKTELMRFSIKDLEAYLVTDDENKMVYLENPVFLVSVKSGSRNVVAEVPVSTTAIDAIFGSGGGGTLKHVGGLQSDKNGGIYSGGSSDLYDYYKTELEKLLNKSDADYNRVRTSESNIITDPNFYTKSIYEAYDWNKVYDAQSKSPNSATAKYINTWGEVTLGKANTITYYPSLEYIKTGNSLKVLGTVYCPNLKGVSVVGVNIGESDSKQGIFYCPSLETLYSAGGNMTVYKGSAINPMDVDGTGKVTNLNKPTTPSGSCNFYGNSVITIKCSTEINWCRFNFSDIAVEYGNKGKLTSNSIFISRNWVELSGTASSDTSRVIPQFYSRGYIKYSGDSPGNVTGIFMTPSNERIFNNGNGVAEDTQFTGLFVGNCDIHGQTMLPPVYWANNIPIGQYYKNGQPRDDFEVNNFGDDTYELIMDGDWIMTDTDGGGSGKGGEDASVSLQYKKGVIIREAKR